MWYVVNLLTGASHPVLEATVTVVMKEAYADGWGQRMALAKMVGLLLSVEHEVYLWRWLS